MTKARRKTENDRRRKVAERSETKNDNFKIFKIFSKINNFKSTILLILFVLLASAADYIILYGQKTSALIMLIISACIFLQPQSNFKIGKKTAFIILAVNIPILILSVKTRIYIFNILMLSYTLWYIITPYVIKFKRFYSVFFRHY